MRENTCVYTRRINSRRLMADPYATSRMPDPSPRAWPVRFFSPRLATLFSCGFIKSLNRGIVVDTRGNIPRTIVSVQDE